MIQNEVVLEPKSHKYFDTQGREYTSVSKVLDSVEHKFDEEGISRQCAGKGKYAGMSQAEVKAQWKATAKESTDHGTRLHNSIEYYAKNFSLKEEDSDLLPLAQSIAKLHSGYVRTYDECALYHPEYFIAGTADRILQPTSRSSVLDIVDYKSNAKKGILYYSEYGKFKKFPVDHLSDCNYNRYACQMSCYGVMLEILTGKKIRALNIIYIPPDNFLNYQIIPTPFMKTDAISIMKHFHENKNKSTKPLLMSADVDAYEEPTF